MKLNGICVLSVLNTYHFVVNKSKPEENSRSFFCVCCCLMQPVCVTHLFFFALPHEYHFIKECVFFLCRFDFYPFLSGFEIVKIKLLYNSQQELFVLVLPSTSCNAFDVSVNWIRMERVHWTPTLMCIIFHIHAIIYYGLSSTPSTIKTIIIFSLSLGDDAENFSTEQKHQQQNESISRCKTF